MQEGKQIMNEDKNTETEVKEENNTKKKKSKLYYYLFTLISVVVCFVVVLGVIWLIAYRSNKQGNKQENLKADEIVLSDSKVTVNEKEEVQVIIENADELGKVTVSPGDKRIAYAVVEGDAIIISGISEGTTPIVVSTEETNLKLIYVTVNASRNSAENDESSDEESAAFIPLESDEEPDVIPNGFRMVYVKMNGKEVPAWTDNEFYIFYAQVSSGEEVWVIYDVYEGTYIRYDSNLYTDE